MQMKKASIFLTNSVGGGGYDRSVCNKGLPDGNHYMFDLLSMHVFSFHGLYDDIHVIAS